MDNGSYQKIEATLPIEKSSGFTRATGSRPYNREFNQIKGMEATEKKKAYLKKRSVIVR